jgi:hypothetical protein
MSGACGSNILCCNGNSPFDDECGELCKIINPRNQDFIKILKILKNSINIKYPKSICMCRYDKSGGHGSQIPICNVSAGDGPDICVTMYDGSSWHCAFIECKCRKRSAGSRAIERLEDELENKVLTVSSYRFIILLISPRIRIQVDKLESELQDNLKIPIYVMRCLEA